MTTHQPSYKSTAGVMNNEYVATLGEAASSFLFYPAVFYHPHMRIPLYHHFAFSLGTLMIPPTFLFVSLLVCLRPLVQRFIG